MKHKLNASSLENLYGSLKQAPGPNQQWSRHTIISRDPGISMLKNLTSSIFTTFLHKKSAYSFGLLTAGADDLLCSMSVALEVQGSNVSTPNFPTNRLKKSLKTLPPYFNENAHGTWHCEVQQRLPPPSMFDHHCKRAR